MHYKIKYNIKIILCALCVNLCASLYLNVACAQTTTGITFPQSKSSPSYISVAKNDSSITDYFDISISFEGKIYKCMCVTGYENEPDSFGYSTWMYLNGAAYRKLEIWNSTPLNESSIASTNYGLGKIKYIEFLDSSGKQPVVCATTYSPYGDLLRHAEKKRIKKKKWKETIYFADGKTERVFKTRGIIIFAQYIEGVSGLCGRANRYVGWHWFKGKEICYDTACIYYPSGKIKYRLKFSRKGNIKSMYAYYENGRISFREAYRSDKISSSEKFTDGGKKIIGVEWKKYKEFNLLYEGKSNIYRTSYDRILIPW